MKKKHMNVLLIVVGVMLTGLGITRMKFETNTLIFLGALITIVGAALAAWATIQKNQPDTNQANAVNFALGKTIETADLTLQTTNESLKKTTVALDKADTITVQQLEIIETQRLSILENEYQNFRAGIVCHQDTEKDIREWYERIRALGISPPRSPYLIVIQRQEGINYTPDLVLVDFAKDNNKVTIRTAERDYPNVPLWRGLCKVLLGINYSAEVMVQSSTLSLVCILWIRLIQV